MICGEWIIKGQGWKPEDLLGAWHRNSGALGQTQRICPSGPGRV